VFNEGGMIIMFRKRYAFTKYTDIVKQLQLDKATDIKTAVVKLKEGKNKLFLKSTSDLKLIQIELSSLVEDNKQVALLTSTMTITIAVFTIITNLMKETAVKGDPYFTLPLLIIYIGVLLIGMLRITRRFSISARQLNLLNDLLTLLIKERDLWDEKHAEAYAEYLK
jgi:hypothetical protein